jgi:tetratricopeptide (TPR) repeat protein
LVDQARAINEALAAHRALGYNFLHLAIIHNVSGDYRKGRQYAEQSLQEFSSTQDARGKIFALHASGRVLIAMGDAAGAFRRFSEMRELALNQGIAAPVNEAAANLAMCAVMQGQLDEARKYVHEAWDYLKTHGGMGVGNPFATYRNCAEVFDALGEVENLKEVLEVAHQELMDAASKINVPAWRQSFMQNVPYNRELLEMWEHLKQ